MPSGRVHNLINIAVYSVLAAGTIIATRQELISITPAQALNFSIAFMVGTFLLSPDLDLSEGKVDSKRHWGILGVLWVPYGMIFSHRGLSHTWIIGPLTRIAYMAVVLAIITGLLKTFISDFRMPVIPQPISIKFIIPIIVGYYLSQWLHLVADGVRPDHGVRKGIREAQKVSKKIKRRL